MLNRIALITDGIYPYVIGGMQKHSYYLAKFMAQKGVHVDLYHTNQSEYDVAKLQLFSPEEKHFIRSFVIPFPPAGKLPGRYIRGSYQYSKAIYEVFRQNSLPDFIYIKGFSGWKLLEEKAGGLKLPPIGVNFHGYEMFQKPPSFRSFLESKFLLQKPVLNNIRKADYLFSYGGKITTLIEALGVTRDRIIEIPTGIERSWLAEPVNHLRPLKFVFVGRYESRKGIQEINDVLSQLAGKNTFEFHFVGPIPDEKQVRMPEVNYHGKITGQEELKLLLSKMDILVCPSHSEGMPNVIVEAMAAGLGIIATDVGAVSAMVDKSNGWLIPPCDTIALKNVFLNAIDTPSDELFAIKQYSIGKVREQLLWEDIIDQTIRKINLTLSD